MLAIVRVIHAMALIITNAYLALTYFYTIIFAILLAQMIYTVFQLLGIVS